MKITKEQYKIIEEYFPKQHGNVKQSNLEVMNALLYILENGCKWRALPEELGRWHSVYMRMSRWREKGVLQKVFEELQKKGIIEINVENIFLDSTTVKVHPNGTGALKKTGNKQ